MRSPDVIVVGGGVIGCAVAWALAREGLAVRLLERGEIAGEASGAAAGMLAPLGEAAAPGPLQRWGLRALDAFPTLARELRERSGVDVEYEPSGVLYVAAAGASGGLRELAQRAPERGLVWLDPAELGQHEPRLRAPEGALLSPGEGHLRSPLLVRAYAGAARASGAEVESGVPVLRLLRERSRVVGVETDTGRCAAGAVVLCAGSWTPACMAGLAPGSALPITPVRGQIVALDAPQPTLRRIVWGPGAYLVPKRDGSLVVGATEEHVGFDRRVTAGGLRSLLEAAPRLLPCLSESRFRSAWAGLRPETPDHLPLVGPLPGLDGLCLAAGHHRNGVLLSAVTGEIVRDGLLGKGWAEPAFLPERWQRPAPSADASVR